MKASTKAGLITTGLYAATSLALPAFAAVKEEPKEAPVEVINLENVKTTKEADELFHIKIQEYSLDKKLSSGEVRNLHSILIKEKQLLDEGKFTINENYFKGKKETEPLVQERTKLEKELKQLEEIKEPDTFFLSYLSEKIGKIEDELNWRYPGILDKKNTKLNLSYPADMRLESSGSIFKEIARTVHHKISSRYNDNSLELISEKDSEKLTLRDVALLLECMESYKTKLENVQDSLKVGVLKERIDDLRSQENRIWQKILSNKEKEGIDSYVNSQSELNERLVKFSEYINFEDKSKEFIEKFDDYKKYWSFSLVAEEKLYKKAPVLYTFLSKDNQRLSENSLNQYLKSEGLEAKVAELKNPRLCKFPAWWFILINGFSIPIVRNLLIRKYVGDDCDSAYGWSTGAGFGNGFVGLLVTDGLHPAAFWIRMATPLAIQPIKRLLNIKDV